MPLDIEIEIQADVVCAKVSGAFDLDNAKTLFQKILQTAHKQCLNKILIDARSITGNISTMARFDFATFMSELFPIGIKIAIVGSTEVVWSDRFLENVANNRGVNTKVTTDITEAMDWLKAE